MYYHVWFAWFHTTLWPFHGINVFRCRTFMELMFLKYVPYIELIFLKYDRPMELLLN